MTEIPSSVHPPSAAQLDHLHPLNPNLLPRTNGLPDPPPLQEEDEPYTIKCICSFAGDDGSTVQCERCETWQHIQCYYPDTGVHDADIHNCVDCEPRPLDHKQATERQQKRLKEARPTPDRPKQTKRPPPKSHRKKNKDNGPPAAATNGWSAPERPDGARHSEGKSGSPRDQPPPAKRPKTSHRTSSSVSSYIDTKSPAAGPASRHRSSSNPNAAPVRQPSPNTSDESPGKHGQEAFSPEFMRLSAEDPGDSPLEANLFNNLKISGALSSWVHDPEALSRDTQIETPAKVFERVDCSFDALDVPDIVKKTKRDESIEYYGDHPTWNYLVVDSFVPENGLVGEIKGRIGHKSGYREEPHNRWAQLRHPLPFVFFHPHLPLYIDTRHEGTRCRYVRRSCRPNVTMRTIVSNGTECHFCLRALGDLSPGTEIAVGWCYAPGMFDSFAASLRGESLPSPEREDTCAWIEGVLANFGGCACENPKDCVLATVLRQQSAIKGESNARPSNGSKPKRTRKSRQHPSPPNTGPSNGSRAGSEAFNRDQDDDQDDSRSTSESIRSKPRSRDMTPMTHLSSTDGPPTATEPEISDREKRKIAALERKFELMEQDQEQHASKKKKRNSGGSTLATPLPTSSVSRPSVFSPVLPTNTGDQKQMSFPSPFASQPTTPHVGSKPHYADVGISSRKSDSPSLDIKTSFPHNMPSPSKPSRGSSTANSPKSYHLPDRTNYTDSSTQTEMETGDEPWYRRRPSNPPPRKTFIPLTQRLLRKFHDDKVRLQESRRRSHDEMAIDHEQGHSEVRLPNGVSEEPRSLSPLTQTGTMLGDANANVKQSQSPPFHPIDPNAQSYRPPEPVASPVSEHNADENPTDRIKAPPHPGETTRPVNGFRSTDLRVDLPPTFSTSSSTATATPLSASSTMAHSPFGPGHGYAAPAFSPSVVSSVVQHSPIKKKLSLSEYTRSRGSNKVETPTVASGGGGSPNAHASLKPSSSLAEEARLPGVMEGSAVDDTPSKEG
ncbi:MAG: hypothetical protein M4579_006962 [Chaenotheca gracillima]|nr:MAG: hypothetical protein M4579_006962 [Chaenotheca gracillima]